MTLDEARLSAEDRARRAGCPVVDFDPEADPAFRTDLYGQWLRARGLGPVFYSTAAQGFWVLSGYEEIHEALNDPTSFSAQLLMAFSRRASTDQKLIPMTMDPPEHTAYRQLLTPLLGPRAVKSREPQIRATANRLIDDILAAGNTCEFMRAFAYKLPGQVFGTWLGLDEEAAAQYTELATAQVHYKPQSDPDGAEFARMQAAIAAVVTDLIEARKSKRADDIVSALLDAEVHGRSLTDDELLRIATLLFLAGFDTTAGAIGEVISHLARHAEHQTLSREDAEVRTRLIEECLRFYAISGSSGRLVIRDREIAGCPMEPGDRIFSSLQAANRDPRVFDHPDEMDIDRWPNRHAAFGMGIHRCLGSHVARAELNSAVSEWLRRIPAFSVADGASSERNVSITTALVELPLVLGTGTS